MKTGILIGIIALGSAAVAFGTSGVGAGSAGDDPSMRYNGMKNALDQPSGVHPYTLPDGTLVCPCDDPSCPYWNGHNDGQPTVNADSIAKRASHQKGCRHWYRWFVPGHSNQCDWNNNARGTPTGCCG